MKKFKLGDDDGRAVDMVLDQRLDAKKTGVNGYLSPSHQQLSQRIEAADRLLSVLSNMPEPELAADLVARTLKRIEQAEHPAAHLPPLSPEDRPHL